MSDVAPFIESEKFKRFYQPIFAGCGAAMLFLLSLFTNSCGTTSNNSPQNNSNASASARKDSDLENVEIIFWSWERKDDFGFIKTASSRRLGVAFYAQTLLLEDENVLWKPRRQSLEIPEGVKTIAVTRIETTTYKTRVAPKFSEEQIAKIVDLTTRTAQLKNVSEVQIDFDALESERDSYREILQKVRAELPPDVPLSMTALASWCIGETWLKDLPVTEAVPMLFRLGRTDASIKSFLSAGKDFTEPLCRKSYGVSTDENFPLDFQSERRVYFFKDGKSPWQAADLSQLERFQP